MGPVAEARRGSSRRSVVLAVGALGLVLLVVAAVVVLGSGREEQPAAAPERAAVVVLPVSPVGADLSDGDQTAESADAAVVEAAELGAGGIRVTADLSWLCERDGCDTAPLDPVVERARELGLRVYLHVNSTPGWMDPRGTWYGPEGADARRWAELFGELVARFGTEVAGYEVWNEPNNEEFWQQGPDPAAYADLLKAAWTAAKDVDPDVQIIGGVLSNNDLGYMSALSSALEDRGGNLENTFFYDQLGVHPYAGGPSQGFAPDLPAGSADETVEFGTKDMTFLGMERLRAQVAEDEGIWRDVVVGEFGYSTEPGAWYHVPEPRRAEYLAAALRLAADREWVEAFTFYGYHDRSVSGFAIEETPSEAAVRRETEALRD